jgi:hypothetical protein
MGHRSNAYFLAIIVESRLFIMELVFQERLVDPFCPLAWHSFSSLSKLLSKDCYVWFDRPSRSLPSRRYDPGRDRIVFFTVVTCVPFFVVFVATLSPPSSSSSSLLQAVSTHFHNSDASSGYPSAARSFMMKMTTTSRAGQLTPILLPPCSAYTRA